MPTYTNYNNYIKAKANSAVCCTSAGHCVGGGTSGSGSGTGTADFSKLTAADNNINLIYIPGDNDPTNATAVQIGFKQDIFAHTLTLSNETLIFQDACGQSLSLGYKAPLTSSYSLNFPSTDPSGLIQYGDSSGYALVTNLSGQLDWFPTSLNAFDASLQYLYDNLSSASGIKIRDVVSYITYSEFSHNDLSFNTVSSSLTFHDWNFATSISFEDISNNGDVISGTRFLINGQTDATQNGIYKINHYTAGVSFELVRDSDMQPDSCANNIYVFVTETGQGWLQKDGSVTVGESSLNFVKFSEFEAELTDIVAGTNIDVSKNRSEFTISLKDDISLSSIDISKSLTLSDASLVFKISDNSLITITAPSELSHSYNLTLPKAQTDKSGNFLKVDSSGQLYFSNLLDLTLGELSNLDLSYNGTEYILKLLQDISITSLDVSSAITLKSSTSSNNNRITLKGPIADASYILTFPNELPSQNLSGGFLQSTASGDLYFSNAWLNTISGDHNIDICINKTSLTPYTKISLNPDISVSTIDVSNSINLIDASLVFYAKDSSAVTIVAPTGISNEYTLTLPISHIPDQSGNFLRVDGSGQLYFADASLNDLSGGKNIDISYGTDYNIISLNEDISLTNIELSGNLTFSIGDNSNVTIGIPQDVSSYSLKLPFSHSQDQSGNFLRVDGSGQLYFADASLNDLSGSTNIDISYGTNYNFISLAKDIKDISSIALDSSLVFNVSDTSSITIIPPTDISNSYSLTLPSDLKAGLLRSDENGILSFTDASLGDLSGSTNIDISNRDGFNIISLKSDLQDISSITLDSSLVFNLSDGSAITIVAPTDTSGYTLKLPKNYKEVTESSGQFLRVDGSGQLYFADASLDIISIEPGDSNLTISSEKTGDIRKFTIDLCSNLDLSSITLDNDLTFKDDGKIVFEGSDPAHKITIDISKSGLDKSYSLQLPLNTPEDAIIDTATITYDDKAFITVDNSGVMKFQNLQNLLNSVTTGINAREAVRYIANNVSSNIYGTRNDISGLVIDFTAGNTIQGLSLASDFSFGDRILINNVTNAIWNGIYTISGGPVGTTIPSTDNSFLLVRALDFDEPHEANNAFVFVTDGPAPYQNTGWILSYKDNSNVTIGDHSINFVQFTGEQSINITGDNDNITVITSDVGNTQEIKLNKNINIDRVTLSNSAELVFAGGDSNANLILTAPEDASYTLTLPHQADSSGAYTRVDGSGNLYFEDISLHDISLVSISHNLIIDTSLIDQKTKRFTLDLCNNLTLEKLTISNELIVAKDASLVFHTTDGSAIKIVAPQDASAYTLILPSDLSLGGYLKADQSGNLSFVDISNIQTDISLVSKTTNLIIDVSNFEGDISGFIFDLCDNLIVENLTISGGEIKINYDSSLVFGIEDGSSIRIVAPHDISNEYTLTLPTDLSLGGYLKADQSGNLSFVDISNIQTDISLVSKTTNLIIDVSNFEGDISGFIFDLCDNLIVENLTISGGEIKINYDSSLVFQPQDGSAITIVAPQDTSGYTLTLPKNIINNSIPDRILVTDGSGILNFKDFWSIQTHNQQLQSVQIGSHFNNILSQFITITNLNDLITVAIYNRNRQLLAQGVPMVYYLPTMTFNSNRESSADNSFIYYDFDTNEYLLFKSGVKYLNERNLLHAINFNFKNVLNFTSIQNILTNFIDSWNSFITKPFFNVMANDFYLKVLNLATVLKSNNITGTNNNNNLIYTHNSNIAKFIDNLAKLPNTIDHSFNGIPCVLPCNLNPPYYFDLSGDSSSSDRSIGINYDPSYSVNVSGGTQDGSFNNLLVFGDVEYEQNFFTLKNALINDPDKYINNDNVQNSKNIVFYFYCQNTNGQDNTFDNLLSYKDYNYWNDFNYDFSSTAVDNSASNFDITLYFDGSLVTTDFSYQILDINKNASSIPYAGDTTATIYTTNSVLFDENVNFNVKYGGKNYLVTRDNWTYETYAAEHGSNGLGGIAFNISNYSFNSDGGDFILYVYPTNEISNNLYTTISNNHITMQLYINQDVSDVFYYDYGNIMFALDQSFNDYLDLSNTNNSVKYDKILIPPLFQLNRFDLQIDTLKAYINFETSCNLIDSTTSIPIEISGNQYQDGSFRSTSIDGDGSNFDISFISEISIAKKFQFIECLSSNTLYTISFDQIDRDLSNNDSSNILIICPLIEQSYQLDALQTNSVTRNFSNIEFKEDIRFNQSLSRYFPIYSYFNTLRKKSSDTSYNISIVISTNESDAINNIINSERSGTYFTNTGEIKLEKNLFLHTTSGSNNKDTNIFLTHYDKPNKIALSESKEIQNLHSIAPQNIETYLDNNRSNLIEKILIHNYNSLDFITHSITDDLKYSNVLTNYTAIDSLINSYMLYLLYEVRKGNGKDLVNILTQKDVSIYEYFRTIRDFYLTGSRTGISNEDISGLNIIEAITSSGTDNAIRLTEGGINKMLLDLNFSFFQLDKDSPGIDFINMNSDTQSLLSDQFFNFRLGILLLHFSHSEVINNFCKFNDNTTNSTIVHYILRHFPNEQHYEFYNPISRLNYSQIGKTQRFDILQKWQSTYTDIFQYLTINDN